VRAHAPRVAGTITPHHLMINRTSLFQGGLRPPSLLSPRSPSANIIGSPCSRAATSGDACFLHLHLDTAPPRRADQGASLRLCRRFSCRRHGAADLYAGVRRSGEALRSLGNLRIAEWRPILYGPDAQSGDHRPSTAVPPRLPAAVAIEDDEGGDISRRRDTSRSIARSAR